MSFNLRNMRARDGDNGWEHRRALVTDLIRRRQPAIVGTQEAYFSQVEQMLQDLPEYAMVGVGRDDGRQEGEYCAIFFRRDRFAVEADDTFWFSDTPDVPGSRQWTLALARICTWVRLKEPSGAAVTVYNVHLDHASQSARQRSVELLRMYLRQESTGEAVLVLGDFNMEEDNSAMTPLQDTTSGLQDTFRYLHPTAGDCGTFHDFTGRVDGEKIDFIFASTSFQVVESEILRDNQAGRYPSDHFPLRARVVSAPQG